MSFSIESLTREHREIEAALEYLTEAIGSLTVNVDAVKRLEALCLRHFKNEEAFLIWLAARDAPCAAKLRGQHDEAIELAARLHEAQLAGQARDAMYLARRLLAIVQHNIIEEERDVFPHCSLTSRPAGIPDSPPESESP
jgi:hypothetical protein